MLNLISKIIFKLSGWKIISKYKISDRNVVAVFPHTSYWDGIIGFFAMRSMNINYKTLAAKRLFKFPLKYVMKYLMHASPVKNGTLSSIRTSINLFNENDKMSLIICPEGQLKPTDKWNMGFHFIAKKANVNIVFAIFDYKRKTITLDEITNVDKIDEDDMIYYIRRLYYTNSCNAKYDDKFLLPRLKK